MKHLRKCSFCERMVYKLASPSKGLCAACYYRERRNGSLEYVKVRKSCTVSNCENLSVAQGLCEMHYRRLKRRGVLEAERFDRWGHAHSHPLYDSWRWLCRRHLGLVVERWFDFWKFVKDAGERPTPRHRIRRVDINRPYGPDNFYWQSPRMDVVATDKATRNEYMRVYRLLDPDRFKGFDLMKHFGITFEQYNEMLAAQGGVCAICEQQDQAISKHTGKGRDLAVDHCHSTQRVRGLLCSHCNGALGFARDNIEILLRAIAYLEHHQEPK